jgi:hypothetical protein
VCRAAVDRGDRLEPASTPLGPVPPTADSLMGASIAAVHAAHAALDGDDQRAAQHWSAVLTVAVPHRYLLLVCDALEGLGCLAGRHGDAARAALLLAAAGQCRADITYRWRFGFEQRQVDEVWAAAGPAAAGPVLSWQAAAEAALAR